MRMNEIWWRILMMSRWIPADCPAASHCSGHYQRQMQKQLRKRRSGRNRRSHALRCLSWQRLLQRKDNKVMLPFVVSQWTNRFFFVILYRVTAVAHFLSSRRPGLLGFRPASSVGESDARKRNILACTPESRRSWTGSGRTPCEEVY
jgi:hypothetical protein